MAFRLKNDSAFVILASIIIFGAIMTLLNFVVVGTMGGTEEFSGSDDIDFWDNPLSWISTAISGNPVFDFFTLDIEIMNGLGELGNIIRIIYTSLIILGIIDILWIG